MALILPPLVAALAMLLRPARAHGGLANYTVGETWYRGYVVRKAQHEPAPYPFRPLDDGAD